jgi:hypothetical protein
MAEKVRWISGPHPVVLSPGFTSSDRSPAGDQIDHGNDKRYHE